MDGPITVERLKCCDWSVHKFIEVNFSKLTDSNQIFRNHFVGIYYHLGEISTQVNECKIFWSIWTLYNYNCCMMIYTELNFTMMKLCWNKVFYTACQIIFWWAYAVQRKVGTTVWPILPISRCINIQKIYAAWIHTQIQCSFKSLWWEFYWKQ